MPTNTGSPNDKLPPGFYPARNIGIEVTQTGVNLVIEPTYSTSRKTITYRIPIPQELEDWEVAKVRCIEHLITKYGQEDTDQFLEWLEDPAIYKAATWNLFLEWLEDGTWPLTEGRPPPLPTRAQPQEVLWPLFVAKNMEEQADPAQPPKPLIFDELLDFWDLVWQQARERGLA